MAEATTQQTDDKNKSAALEGGTYEILQNRLRKSAGELRARLNQLNDDRKDTFGALDMALLTTERITTEHNCVPRDMVPLGDHFLFGYNVHLGLKQELEVADVFSVYQYGNQHFTPKGLELIDDERFIDDFGKLYKYYRNTTFARFAVIGPHLYMVFRVGKEVKDIKTFKWIINGEGGLEYLDNRSDHEVVFPAQHEFRWERATRDDFRDGKHPHVSIKDHVYVETIGGDLTLKVEDNTDEGQGVYSEPVDIKDQTLDDAEYWYAVVGNLVLLKIKPYQETVFRYIIFNKKLSEARRVDAIKDTCVFLPDDHGIIFPNGYYLQTGEFKQFEIQLEDMVFEKRILSPNGEDFVYVFLNRLSGQYLLLPYNLIAQQVQNPITCHGYSIFENGEMVYFRAEDEPSKHHAVQIWQTPYVGPNYVIPVHEENYLFKIGNKEIVRAMAECNELMTLIGKEDSYGGLYGDLIRISTDLLDSFHWLTREETHQLNEPIDEIRQTANQAVEEFEKVRRIRASTQKQVSQVSKEADELIRRIKNRRAEHILDYVGFLSDLRRVRGEVISLKELRYVDLDRVANYESQLEEFTDSVSQNTVQFLLRKEALDPYRDTVQGLNEKVQKVTKVVLADELDTEISQVAGDLEMLIEIVSNLDIEDATQTTEIIDRISNIYSEFNKIKAALKNKRRELALVEGQAEFNAQLKLIDQGSINYLDVADTPEKVDEYLTKLMVQLEELEGRFSEFDDYIDKLSVKREELYNAFESRKVALIEARNKRANTLMSAAERIIKAVKSRLGRFESVAEINGYYASDLMIEKARNIVDELLELGDSVKADDVQSQLKTAREEAVRQLKDRTELYVDGQDVIKLGNHAFSVNTQPLELTTVFRNDSLYYHLTGTNFFEEVIDETVQEAKDVWDQSLVSENRTVYRGEYLAYSLLDEAMRTGSPAPQAEVPQHTVLSLSHLTEEEVQAYVAARMATRFNEGYVKGVHDADAAKLLSALVRMVQAAGLLRFPPTVRALATLYWYREATAETKAYWTDQLKGVGAILQVFPETHEFDDILADLQEELTKWLEKSELAPSTLGAAAGDYLFRELSPRQFFIVDGGAAELRKHFLEFIRGKKALKNYEESLKALVDRPLERFRMLQHWLRAYLPQSEHPEWEAYLDETAIWLDINDFREKQVQHVKLTETLDEIQGSHGVINQGTYSLDYHPFVQRLSQYEAISVPMFHAFAARKKELAEEATEDMRLDEFKPRVLSSFVRNRLIDTVYFPLIGANLAKQIGAAGEGKRTDLMGLLLLISPPGYGKTTLMEYLASRLGIVFMKINGPAIGHEVSSVDPADAPNSSSAEELEKLNLSFEMGDNVMIYLDDIQHLNPEFLQKFISLCDAQRRIEGVYKGRTKTYDFRGKKVAVVMAGNPYTESGDKFQIPDMLANRADIYNLGDIIGDSDDAFKLSYLENCLTANSVLNKLGGKSHKDVLTLIRVAETGVIEGQEYEANHSPEEISEYVNLFKKLLRIRDVVLTVNQAYIDSAGMQDEYRTEPPFKLQGSYRDMNKMAEKVSPIMNEAELETVIRSHYEQEAQTLTSGAEANLLKLKQLIGTVTKEEKKRWKEILAVFAKQQRAKGYGGSQVGLVVEQLEKIAEGLSK
ncbi:MAG TPA: AAA family ATPase [Cytophagales bacterium]|nr:AAA family ATPase [Cytophagales bacterium]